MEYEKISNINSPAAGNYAWSSNMNTQVHNDSDMPKIVNVNKKKPVIIQKTAENTPENNTDTNLAGNVCGFCSSVAMAYVPMQQWNTTYTPEEGFEKGTIFPELDL